MPTCTIDETVQHVLSESDKHPEIISKNQRITPNTRFAHIPFRSGHKTWCVGVISQRQINIPGIIFIHHKITPPGVWGIHFATGDKHSGSYFLILQNNSPFSNWEETVGNMFKYIHYHIIIYQRATYYIFLQINGVNGWLPFGQYNGKANVYTYYRLYHISSCVGVNFQRELRTPGRSSFIM